MVVRFCTIYVFRIKIASIKNAAKRLRIYFFIYKRIVVFEISGVS